MSDTQVTIALDPFSALKVDALADCVRLIATSLDDVVVLEIEPAQATRLAEALIEAAARKGKAA